MDNDYLDDYSHAIEPPCKAATKKVQFADDPQPVENSDTPMQEATPGLNDVADSDPRPLLPAIPNPLTDSQPVQPPTDPTAITPSPPKKARLYKDMDNALGF